MNYKGGEHLVKEENEMMQRVQNAGSTLEATWVVDPHLFMIDRKIA
jgi:hypothetical protein